MKQVRVRYFAVLRERADRSEETITTSAATAAALYDEIAARLPLELPRTMLRVAINDEFADWSQELRTGDHVVFIPPVAGG